MNAAQLPAGTRALFMLTSRYQRMCLLVDNVIADRLPLLPGVPILTCGLAIMWPAGGFYEAETKMKVTPLRGKRTLMRFTLK